MKTYRIVPLVAAGLALAVAVVPASAGDSRSNSFLQAEAPLQQAIGSDASDAPQGSWIAAAPIPQGVVRYAHAQCVGENSFYIFSGVITGGQLTNASRRYDAGTNTWTSLANYPAGVGTEGPSGVCYQGKIYVAGGSGTTTSMFIYDIAGNTWSTAPPIPFPTAMSAMGALNGVVFVAGGDNDFSPGTGVSNIVARYDIATNTWMANGAPMPSATSSAGFAQIGDFLYVVGGWGPASPGSNVTASMRYDMVNNTWSTGPAFSGKSDHPLAATNTAIYAIGGDNNGGGFFDISATVERLDITAWPAGAWAPADPLPSPRSGHKGGFCTESFFPAAGEVWSTGGIANPFPTFDSINWYLQAEACPSLFTLDPVALAVDPSGNNVLEPAEAAVVVAPSWLNGDTVAVVNLTGAASNFTGPGGATYTINDSTAAYGTVAAGATNSCLSTGDCYAVTVAAATRPAVHWDSQLTETLTPSGITKDWTLHVGASFTDVPTSNPFYRFIETLIHHSVTGGCGPTTYCPQSSTTREQMAVFVLIAKEGAGYTPPSCSPPNLFADVPETSPFCRYIEELANRQVVTGCGPNLYCPTANVTREQMAIFVLRTLDPALNPPACVAGSEMFNDVPASSPFCRWVEELARRAVVTGCGGGAYCPTASVTREQMGVFISVTFGLTLYGP